MSGTMQPPEAALSLDLLAIYDDFVDLQSSYAFLFDAMTALMIANSDFDRSTIDGIASLAEQMKNRSNTLQDQLKEVHDRFRALQ